VETTPSFPEFVWYVYGQVIWVGEKLLNGHMPIPDCTGRKAAEFLGLVTGMLSEVLYIPEFVRKMTAEVTIVALPLFYLPCVPESPYRSIL
jgi:hypothetical protein